MSKKVTDFTLGQKILHPDNGEGIVVEVDVVRGLISCKYAKYPNQTWRSLPDLLQFCEDKTAVAPCLHQNESVQKSQRHNKGKIQTREVDPDFILGIGEVLTKSREKYDAFNWQKDTPFSVPYESLMRHLMAFQKGEEIDSESGCHHLLHVATNVMFLYYHRNNIKMDDRGFKKK